MGGGSGDNYMTGDEGADTVCGDGGLGQKNNIYAGDTNNGSVDRLWGGGTGLPGIPGDWAYCGSSSTYWGEVDDTTDCNGAKEIYTKPGDCPI